LKDWHVEDWRIKDWRVEDCRVKVGSWYSNMPLSVLRRVSL